MNRYRVILENVTTGERVTVMESANVTSLYETKDEPVDEPDPRKPPQMRRMGVAWLIAAWDHADPNWKPDLVEMAMRLRGRA